MKIAIGSDHKGYEYKQAIISHLEQQGIDMIDLGTHSTNSCDYPDYAGPVAHMVANHEVDFGILICYTGIGMSMAANKVKGVRAALCDNLDNVILTREHNNANILCMGAKTITLEESLKFSDTFIHTNFLGERHEKRINKITELENE